MRPETQVAEVIAWETGDYSLAIRVAGLIIETGANVEALAEPDGWQDEVWSE